MLTTLVHLAIIVLILGAIAYFISWAPIQPPIVKTVLWIIFIVIALIALLPLLGIHVGSLALAV